ncbi:MAG: phosphate signaling complex protein PhoU [Ignavibacteria bacterium]|nr:phosphate signaling complex protein PhoU [Ignavibacteria bacterium]
MASTFIAHIEELNRLLLQMATMSEEMVRRSLEALRNQNVKAARVVILRDDDVDSLENTITAHILRSLSDQHPVAVDLRFFLSAQKITNDLERVADHAVNIAESAIALADAPHVKPLVNIPKMTDIVVQMLKEAIDSFVYRDTSLALAVRRRDDEIDELHKLVRSTLSAIVKDEPHTFDRALHLLDVSTDLERIADLATNIAEEVFFITDAEVMKHKEI